MSGKAQGNIQVYRKKWNFNIGIVIFGVILIYLVVTVLTYATAKHVTAYEVREGSIFRDTAYTGHRMRERDAWQGKYFHYLGGAALRK